MKRRCKTCKWYEEFMGVCYNGDSPHFADFTDPKQRCREWERKEAYTVKPAGGIAKKITCQQCGKRRYGVTYQIEKK